MPTAGTIIQRNTTKFCASGRASRSRGTASSSFPMKSSATRTEKFWPTEKRRMSFAGVMAVQKRCPRNMKQYSTPSSRRNRIGSKHEHRAERKRPHFFSTLRCCSPGRTSSTDGFSDRADEGFARRGGTAGGFGGHGLRNQYGLRETCVCAYLHGAGAPTASESSAIA